jgi:hypothetical protein
MDKRRVIQTIIAFALTLSLACGLIPNLRPSPIETSISASPTDLLQFTDLFPSEAPTPLSTTIPSLLETTFIGAEITDSGGKAIIETSNSAVYLSIEAKDTSSNKPLEDIQIQAFLVDNKTRVLVIALDPNNEYFPLIKVVDNPVSQKDNKAKASGVTSVKAQTGLEFALLMAKIVETINTGKSAFEYFMNLPELKKYSFWYADYCFTGDNLASFFGFASGIVFIPIPGENTELERQILEAIFKISTHTAGQDVENYLRSLPDKYLIRIHHFPKPKFSDLKTFALSLIGFEYLGKCDTPTFTPSLAPTTPTVETQLPTLTNQPTPALLLDRKSVESVMEWTSYGLANGDITVFEKLITDDYIYYGHGMTGGRNQISRVDFLNLLTARIMSRPICEGYVLISDGDTNAGGATSIWVFTSAWKPEWVDDKVSSEFIHFALTNKGDGFAIYHAYFQPAPAMLDYVDHQPCSTVP